MVRLDSYFHIIQCKREPDEFIEQIVNLIYISSKTFLFPIKIKDKIISDSQKFLISFAEIAGDIKNLQYYTKINDIAKIKQLDKSISMKIIKLKPHIDDFAINLKNVKELLLDKMDVEFA